MFSKSSIVQVVSLCGACIALYIGSGFATMQEVMQYEASYGSLFWAVVLALLSVATVLGGLGGVLKALSCLGASHHCVPARYSGRICACAHHGL